jgi:hypothetical protein
MLPEPTWHLQALIWNSDYIKHVDEYESDHMN